MPKSAQQRAKEAVEAQKRRQQQQEDPMVAQMRRQADAQFQANQIAAEGNAMQAKRLRAEFPELFVESEKPKEELPPAEVDHEKGRKPRKRWHFKSFFGGRKSQEENVRTDRGAPELVDQRLGRLALPAPQVTISIRGDEKHGYKVVVDQLSDDAKASARRFGMDVSTDGKFWVISSSKKLTFEQAQKIADAL